VLNPIPLVLTRSATLRGCAALLAALHLTVAAAGPLAHALAGDAGTGRVAWSAAAPGASRPLHDPSACAVCLLQAGGFVPTSVQPLDLAARDAGVEPPAVLPATRAFPPQWRILPRPPPSSSMA
jgi:hypothetical protein